MRCGCCTFLLNRWGTAWSWPFFDRRHHVPRKITVQSGAQRHPEDAEAAGRSALDGDLCSVQDWTAGRMAAYASVRSAA